MGLTDGFSWTHVGRGVAEALRGIAALGLPLGIVSNSTGEVEQALRQLDVCYASRRRRGGRRARASR